MSEEEKRDVQLQNRNFKQAEVVRNRWSVVLAPEHEKSDLNDPRFWAHVALNLANGDLIEVRTEGETAFGEFIVIECSRIHAKVQELRWVELGQTVPDAGASDLYEYKWKGPSWRHCVVRKADGHVLAKELPSKDAALQWIVTNRKAA